MTATMHWQLDLADSELSSVRFEGATLELRFAAVRVRPAGGARGEGPRYLGGVVLLMADARADTPLGGCIGRVAEVDLLIAGRRHATVAAPLDCAAPATLVLQCANGGRLSASGTALRVQWPASASPAEHFHC